MKFIIYYHVFLSPKKCTQPCVVRRRKRWLKISNDFSAHFLGHGPNNYFVWARPLPSGSRPFSRIQHNYFNLKKKNTNTYVLYNNSSIQLCVFGIFDDELRRFKTAMLRSEGEILRRGSTLSPQRRVALTTWVHRVVLINVLKEDPSFRFKNRARCRPLYCACYSRKTVLNVFNKTKKRSLAKRM